MKLFFSLSGRLDQKVFWKAAILLIIIGVIGALLPLINFKLSMAFMIVSLITLWCWIAIWAKRYHDAGKSGWMALIPVCIFIFLIFAVSFVLSSQFGMSGEEKLLFEEKIQDAAAANNMGAVWAMTMEVSEFEAKKNAIPSAIASGLLGLIFVWLFNNVLIKSDPNKNQYDDIP